MKKLNHFFIPVLFLFALGFTACESKTDTTTETEEVVEEQPISETPAEEESPTLDTSTPDGAWTVLAEFDRQKYASAEQLTQELAGFSEAVPAESLDSLKAIITEVRAAFPDRKTMSRDDITAYDNLQDVAIEMITRLSTAAPTCENCKALTAEIIRLDNQSIVTRSLYDQAATAAGENVQLFTVPQ